MTPTEKVVSMIAAAYPVPSWEPETLRLYAHALSDIDPDVLRAVGLVWIQREKERPAIAALREMAVVAQDGGALDPEVAWRFVQRCILRLGHARDFPNTHPLVAEAVSALGWERICMSQRPELERVEFLKLYRSLQERRRRDAATRRGAIPAPAITAQTGQVRQLTGRGNDADPAG